jgi:drug/metabolite transporter (DMT)-like permease
LKVAGTAALVFGDLLVLVAALHYLAPSIGPEYRREDPGGTFLVAGFCGVVLAILGAVLLFANRIERAKSQPPEPPFGLP